MADAGRSGADVGRSVRPGEPGRVGVPVGPGSQCPGRPHRFGKPGPDGSVIMGSRSRPRALVSSGGMREDGHVMSAARRNEHLHDRAPPGRPGAAGARRPEAAARELRLAAAIEFYREGRVSQGQGA